MAHLSAKSKTCRTVIEKAQALLDVIQVEKKSMKFQYPDRVTVALIELERSINDLR